ncbi:extensin-like [Homarus americanus]|uniref:extensin-like n=1 Tax=Homarus americanus TaxID=6706 RepID=UPI001C43ABC2|nr:extensin-like [Homarus americanus]
MKNKLMSNNGEINQATDRPMMRSNRVSGVTPNTALFTSVASYTAVALLAALETQVNSHVVKYRYNNSHTDTRYSTDISCTHTIARPPLPTPSTPPHTYTIAYSHPPTPSTSTPTSSPTVTRHALSTPPHTCRLQSPPPSHASHTYIIAYSHPPASRPHTHTIAYSHRHALHPTPIIAYSHPPTLHAPTPTPSPTVTPPTPSTPPHPHHRLQSPRPRPPRPHTHTIAYSHPPTALPHTQRQWSAKRCDE